MRSLNSEPQTLFRALFLNQLPPEVRRILAQSPDVDLNTLAKTAGRTLEVDSVAATCQRPYPTTRDRDEQQMQWCPDKYSESVCRVESLKIK